MAKYKNKTQQTDADVLAFFESVKDEQKREDCEFITRVMEDAVGEPAKMWGKSIVGFGKYEYRTKSGCNNDWFYVGFSPRKANMTLYITCTGLEKYKPFLEKLGNPKTGVGCVYFKTLKGLDEKVLKDLIKKGIKDTDSFMVDGVVDYAKAAEDNKKAKEKK